MWHQQTFTLSAKSRGFHLVMHGGPESPQRETGC